MEGGTGAAVLPGLILEMHGNLTAHSPYLGGLGENAKCRLDYGPLASGTPGEFSRHPRVCIDFVAISAMINRYIRKE